MDDAVVLLWTTHKFLPDAFDILKEWGLDYKATLVWNKEKLVWVLGLGCNVSFVWQVLKVNHIGKTNSKRTKKSKP